MAVPQLPNGLLDLSDTPEHLLAIAARNAIESPLLRLPAELRNYIFQYASSSGHQILIRRLPGPHPSSGYLDIENPLPIHLEVVRHGTDRYVPLFYTGMNLALVSRQLYCETATLPYVHNSLVLVLNVARIPPRCVAPWVTGTITALMPHRRALVQAIAIHGSLWVDTLGVLERGKHLSRTFPNLQRIYLVIEGLHDPLPSLSEKSRIQCSPVWEEWVNRSRMDGKIELLIR